jgi:small subunit ribosomal protein S9
MTDDEQNKETSKQPTEEPTPGGPVDENSEGESPAGPVAEDDSSSSQAAGEEPPSTPPAGDASEAEQPQDEGESAEPAVEEADEAAPPEAEEPQGSEDTSEAASKSDSSPPSEEAEQAEQTADTPPATDAERSTRAESDQKKKDKADVIPGADLEPIAVEEERELSAEERARLEAEEEERARREAELAAQAEQPDAASRAPAKLDSTARFLATGKRKSAIARVILTAGDGKIEINKRSLEEFFPRPLHQTVAKQPLVAAGYEGTVDVRVRVHGGGISGQAGAVRHGIARALTEIDPELRGDLKRRGFLTRDARVKERRKAGLKKARKRPQFSKR